MQYKDFTIITFLSNAVKKIDDESNNIEKHNGFNCSVYSKYDTACNTPIAVSYTYLEGIYWYNAAWTVRIWTD